MLAPVATVATVAARPAAAAGAAAPSAPAIAAPRAAFGEVLQRHLSAAGPPPAPAGPGTPAGLAARAGEALRGLDQARAQLDRALAQARAGRTFSAQELLALQADTYRFQQAVDVAARVAEAGAQSVRQAVNTQL